MTEPRQTAPASTAAQIHAQMTEAHNAYMQTLQTAHAQYMQATQAMLASASAVPAAAPQPQAAPAPRPVAPPAPAPVAAAPAPQPAPAPVPAAPAPAPASVNAAPTPAPAPAPAQDFTALVTSLVAEKTGYPSDMLEPDMDLEGELGVDSIKQVEILSALREKMPSLPEIEPEQIAELRTIAKIAAFLRPSASAAPAPAPAAPAVHANGNGYANGNGHHIAAAAPVPAPAPAAPSGVNMTELVRNLIADKTGYPPEMLEDDMDLEGELGVDSIKQVEILSALREQMPNLPEVEPEQIAELRSIRKIADFFG